MKPGDHPEFFRLPPPPGRSRESTIRLDREGRFWHDGAPMTHSGMARAFAGWIARHPDDQRYILNNGYDWSYFEVEESPFFVESLRLTGETPVLCLSDGSEEPLDPAALFIGEREVLYTSVKQGAYTARFQPHAQLELGPLLVAGTDGEAQIELGGRRFSVQRRTPPA